MAPQLYGRHECKSLTFIEYLMSRNEERTEGAAANYEVYINTR